MVEPTNELIYRTLQQIQETLAGHTRRFERLERNIEELRRLRRPRWVSQCMPTFVTRTRESGWTS